MLSVQEAPFVKSITPSINFCANFQVEDSFCPNVKALEFPSQVPPPNLPNSKIFIELSTPL